MPHDRFFESQTGHNEFSALRPEEPVIGPLMTKLKKLWELRDSENPWPLSLMQVTPTVSALHI